MRKAISLIVSAILLLSCVPVFAEGFTPAAAYDTGTRVFHAGNIALTFTEGGSGGEVSLDVFAGTPGMDYTDEGYYTYNDYLVGMASGLDWNPHTWETNDDSYILTFNTIGFYDFAVNASGDGYAVVPEMAAALPIDVTAEYAGTYGVEEGETGKVFRIPLNPDAVWENGDKITADDYIYSMQQQLNPKMLNRRADSFYAGEFTLLNAQDYLFAGGTTYIAFTTYEDVDPDAICVDMWELWGMEGCADADGNECPRYVPITDETLYRDEGMEEDDEEAWVSAKYIHDAYLAPGAPYEAYASEYLKVASMAKAVTWDDVGLKKIDEYTIDVIFEMPISEASFYMPYNLSSSWLVYKPLYEANKLFYDADGNAVETEEEAATVTTTYCRSVESTMGYGPYKLTYYELDKQITLERNENWYGYKDGRHLGQFQTDKISTQIITEQATALMAFLAGEIDIVSLVAGDMEKYATSPYIRYEPQSYTTKITFNTDYAKLLEHGTNSQIMVIDEFRQAFSYSLDRQTFASSFTSAGTAGFGLLNYMYVYDPFTGALYRDNDAAKDALVALNGLTYGDGGDYATLEEAYNAMTGYRMSAAKELMVTAYEKAVASGIYDGESPIEITFRVYQNDTIYVQMFTYIEAQLMEAVRGSGFDGKLKLSMVVDPDYYETNYSGGADMIFTTWGGASFSPFEMLGQVYCDAFDGSGNQMEIGFDTTAIALTFNVDGADVTASLKEWADWANSDLTLSLNETIAPFGSLTYDTRCAFFAGMERCFLSYYTTTPVYYRNVASLKSQKVNYAVDTCLQLVLFGTVRYYTYNYDDAGWADYIANNTLDY
ncbi:MAG: ABC transporter substrate-binding protein [Synergistaceae bacterium]|nr:ABC transporter substrate-binding protein [Synergistaceae bacterium]